MFFFKFKIFYFIIELGRRVEFTAECEELKFRIKTIADILYIYVYAKVSRKKNFRLLLQSNYCH